jgi:transposase
MSLCFKPGLRVFVYPEYVDLRAGFDRLSMVIREKMGAKVLDGDFFVFLGRHRKKLKALFYDGTGLVLLNKRMERGRFMALEDLETSEITVDELDWLMRGSTIRRAVFGRIPETNRGIGVAQNVDVRSRV